MCCAFEIVALFMFALGPAARSERSTLPVWSSWKKWRARPSIAGSGLAVALAAEAGGNAPGGGYSCAAAGSHAPATARVRANEPMKIRIIKNLLNAILLLNIGQTLL